nr:CPBP family intramembrane glutamic endopeptidase [Auraticoccus cholistanensis]
MAAGPPAPLRLVPAAGSEYPALVRSTGSGAVRGVVGALAAVALFVLLAPALTQLLLGAVWSLGEQAVPFADYHADAVAYRTPVGVVAGHLGLAVLVPVCCLLMVLLHSVGPRWLVSVVGTPRWRYLLACLLLALPALAGVHLLSVLAAGTPPQWQPQQGAAWFLLAVLLTSPLQAVAEEVFFRGYLVQALGSVVAAPWFGVLASALVFALFHLDQNLWLFLDRFAFGLAAGLLVWRTGGLEAACAAHVVNNVLAFSLAALTGSVAEARALQQIGPLDAVFDVGGFALLAVLAWLVGRRMAVHTRAERPV